MEEKIDLSGLKKLLDNLKESALRSKDYYKFVIGLSTGALIFSVTFIEKFSAAPVYKPLILTGWVCLVISIITGVWLMPKRDSLEVEWKGLIDITTDTKNLLFGLEQDFGKLISRTVIDALLKQLYNDPKDEEKRKELQKDWINPNGRKGIAVVKMLLSELEKAYPAFASSKPDFIREYEEWKQLLTKQGKSLYLPNMLKRFREANQRVIFMDKLMTGSFFAGIILITLFSATNFLGIDIIGLIRRLL